VSWAATLCGARLEYLHDSSRGKLVHSTAPPGELTTLSHVYIISPELPGPTSAYLQHRNPTMAYNKGFNPDRLPMHAEPEQVRIALL
jgi:hypothetical protein